MPVPTARSAALNKMLKQPTMMRSKPIPTACFAWKRRAAKDTMSCFSVDCCCCSCCIAGVVCINSPLVALTKTKDSSHTPGHYSSKTVKQRCCRSAFASKISPKCVGDVEGEPQSAAKGHVSKILPIFQSPLTRRLRFFFFDSRRHRCCSSPRCPSTNYRSMTRRLATAAWAFV